MICQKFPCKLADNAQPESSVYVSSLIGLLTMICHFIKTPQTFFLFSYSRLRLRQTPAFFKSSIQIILFSFSLITVLTKRSCQNSTASTWKKGLMMFYPPRTARTGTWKYVRTANTQISLRIRAAWSEYSLLAPMFYRPQGIYNKKLYHLISLRKSWFESQIFAHT